MLPKLICDIFWVFEDETRGARVQPYKCLTTRCPSDQRNEELPTLLHFAAKYGLKKLTTTLLHCPGALQACSVMNKFGDYPNTLAEKSGFSALRQFIDEFVVSAEFFCSFLLSVADVSVTAPSLLCSNACRRQQPCSSATSRTLSTPRRVQMCTS